MRYFEKIPGERIYLSPVNPDDAELYTKWLNDREITQWLTMSARVISLPGERKWLENAATGDGYSFAIVLREGGRLLGNIGLHNLNTVNRGAELGVFIGEAEDKCKGYGTEAIKLLLDYSFRTLGLHNILLHVNADNARAIACYKKCGFREAGCRREAQFVNGRFVDVRSMDILDREWEGTP